MQASSGIRLALDLGDSTEYVELMPGDNINDVAAMFCRRHGIDDRVEHAIVDEFRRQMMARDDGPETGYYFESDEMEAHENREAQRREEFMGHHSEENERKFESEKPSRFNNGLYERFMESSQRDLDQIQVDNTPIDTPVKNDQPVHHQQYTKNHIDQEELSPGKLLKKKLRESKRHHYQTMVSMPIESKPSKYSDQIRKSKNQKDGPKEVKSNISNPFSHLLSKESRIEAETVDLMSLIQPHSKTDNSEMQSVKNIEKELKYDEDMNSEDEGQLKEIFETSGYFKESKKTKQKKCPRSVKAMNYLHPNAASAGLSAEKLTEMSMSFSNTSPIKDATNGKAKRKLSKHDHSRSRSQQPRDIPYQPPSNMFYDRDDQQHDDALYQDDLDMQRTVGRVLCSITK